MLVYVFLLFLNKTLQVWVLFFYFTHNILYYEIVPDISIEIENKIEIVKDLDLLGIYRKKLFNDPDNIAKYVYKKSKVRKSKYELLEDFYIEEV